jgi:D-3-phosphoglycerate dehydrogenase
VAALLLAQPLKRLEVELVGVPQGISRPAALAALHGALLPALGPDLSLVNVERLAAERAIELVRVERALAGGQPVSIRVRVLGSEDAASFEVAGSLAREGEPRVVELQGYRLEFWPEGHLLVLENRDVPGMVGRIGTALGDAGINIADIHLARDRRGGRALAVLRVDEPATPALVKQLSQFEGILSVRALSLGGGRMGSDSSEGHDRGRVAPGS